jgi:hypothetical protein
LIGVDRVKNKTFIPAHRPTILDVKVASVPPDAAIAASSTMRRSVRQSSGVISQYR